MIRLFDTHVMVDWSARGAPSPARASADALWLCVAGDRPRYFRTRAALMDWLTAFLVAELAAGRRTLAGFDFPFGYPAGFAGRVTGRAEALALWDSLGARVTDGPDNRHNAFAVAEAINSALGGGPFWGRPRTSPHAGVPERRSAPLPHGLREFRRVEAATRGAKSCWQLAYAGSVGAQALTGIAALARLRGDPRLEGVAVWPFEIGLSAPEAAIVLAEIYPSLLAAEIAARAALEPIGTPKDAVQVRVAAEAFAALDAAGRLAPLFSPPLDAPARDSVAREEGWILGAGFEADLRAAAGAGVPKLRDDCAAPRPGTDWTPVETALARLRAALAPVAAEKTVALAEAGGRILARDVTAARAHPPCANSAVDGYGFAAAALGAGPHRLPLAPGRAAAGAPFAGAVAAGQGLRILTGAALPAGVDTVVLQEDAARDGEAVLFERAPKPFANTRPTGEDVAAGAPVLPAGRRLAPQDLALAAATGHGTLPVRALLRVGVLSTGDELLTPGAPAELHQIHDANRPMLLELLRRWGMNPIDLGRAPDDPAAVAAALDRGAAECHAILTTGGASAGDEDHVARLLGARGGLQTWRIAVKPGRPLALGRWSGVPVFGLPGNPVAAFVCALIFARPALGLLAGAGWTAPRGLTLPAAFAKSKKPGRREYLRARLSPEGAVEAYSSEGSGRVSGLVWADGLAELAEDAGDIRPGDPVRYLPFAAFGL